MLKVGVGSVETVTSLYAIGSKNGGMRETTMLPALTTDLLVTLDQIVTDPDKLEAFEFMPAITIANTLLCELVRRDAFDALRNNGGQTVTAKSAQTVAQYHYNETISLKLAERIADHLNNA